MSEIKMTVEARTDFDCETTGLPAERWAEAVFQVNGQEIIMEVSVEKDVTIGIIVGDESAMWKGTLAGLQQIFRGEIKAR